VRRIFIGLLQPAHEERVELMILRRGPFGCNHGRNLTQRGQGRHVQGRHAAAPRADRGLK